MISVTQGQLVFDPPAKAKRVQPTSVEAYRRILNTMPFRERVVLWGLVFCARRLRHQPTAYEVFRHIALWGAFDINTVRPRLTSLKDQGLVANPGKRECSVTGLRVYTWGLTELGHRSLVGYAEPRPETLAIHRAMRTTHRHVAVKGVQACAE